MNDYFDPAHVVSRLKKKPAPGNAQEFMADMVVTVAKHIAMRSQHQKQLMMAEIYAMQTKASEQAIEIVDLQTKLAELERRLG